MRPSKLVVGLLPLLALVGCLETPHKIPNKVPMALAQAVGEDGTLSPNPTFTFTGASIDVTLDGSGSTDADGTIVTYRWLSANSVADGGVGNLTGTFSTDAGPTKAGGRAVPAGQPANWPGTGKKVTVNLGEGIWQFSLWVIDDKGGVSTPSVVTITIGKPDPLTNPAVAMCVDTAFPMVAQSCKVCVCNIDDTCRSAIKDCGSDCWGLINCIGAKCPDFAKTMDISCLTTNCMPFLAGGATTATAAGPCVTMCLDDCKATDMGAAGAGSGAAGTGAAGAAGTAGAGGQ